MPTFAKFALASLSLAALIGGGGTASAATSETLTTLAQKAELLVVAEVTAIDDVKPPASLTLPPDAPALKHATLKILRGLYPANNSPVEAEQFTIQYPSPNATATDAPTLAVGQVALFPLKHVGATWQLIADEDHAVIMPAAAHIMNFDAPDARLLLFRELAGAFTYGNFDTMARAGRYLEALGPDKESPVQPVYALILHELGDSSLHEDPRWVQIAAASYVGLDIPSRPNFGALLDGNLPDSKGLRLAALTLRKTSRFQLDQRLLMTLINHQNDPGWAAPIASALSANFSESASMLAMEREALKDGKSGALQVADALITSRLSPLAPTAADAARAALMPDTDAGQSPPTLDPAGMKAAFALFLRLGNDEAFAAFQERLAQASQTDPTAYQSYLELAGSRDDLPAGGAARVIEICRYYIDDTTAYTTPPANAPDYRLCDQAAQILSRVTKQDFGFKPTDAVATRDAALDRVRNYLRSLK